MKAVVIKKGRERSLLKKHPWVFSGAIEDRDDGIKNGEAVRVVSCDNELLCIGCYSEKSQIALRILSWDKFVNIDDRYFEKAVEKSVAFRKRLFRGKEDTTAYRLINSESDGLPGLIADVYADHIVCQFLSAGAEYYRIQIIEALKKMCSDKHIYDRSDVDVRAKEGLEISKGIIHGDEPVDMVQIAENGVKYFVDIVNGHKTGFYLDQRDNRRLLSSQVDGAEVLNCFSYTCGFGVQAALGGAKYVINIDSSGESLNLGEKNFELNGISSDKYQMLEADVFSALRRYRDEGRSFDSIILDPPKFADAKSAVSGASRGYKDINLLALKLLRPGGRLYTFSCSGLIDNDLFGKIISSAALDSGRQVAVIARMSKSSDHPVLTTFPEGFYLKGLVCAV